MSIYDLDALEFRKAVLREVRGIPSSGIIGSYAAGIFIDEATEEWGRRRKEKAKQKAKAMARAAIRMPWVRKNRRAA